MAYIGNQIRQYSDRVVLDSLTASATANYTLQLNGSNYVPSSAESLTVSLNGVIQKPQNSYTVSGSTLSFASALTASDSIDFVIAERGITLQTPSAGSVNTEQLASNAVTSAKMFSGFKNGITEADQWRLAADTNTGTNADITTNWERPDTGNWSKIGTGLTNSSGIFSFPETGIYSITGHFVVVAVPADTAAGVELRVSTNNFTNSLLASASYCGNGGTANTLNSVSFNHLFDVEDITTHKIKFGTLSFSANSYVYGNTSVTFSGFTVIRLGDT